MIDHAAHPLLRRFEHFVELPAADRAAVCASITGDRTVRAGQDLIREGDKPDHVNVVLSGFVGRYKSLPDGRCQITALYVPGDIFDLRIFVLNEMDHTLTAMTPARVAFIPSGALTSISEAHPLIARALWWSTLVNEAVMGEWLVNVGRRTAYERAAHLICELYCRLHGVGLADGGAMAFPFSYPQISDMLGLSTVHVNRTFRRLIGDGLIAKRRRELVILNIDQLRELAGFNPDYLHLKRGSLAAP